MFGYRSEDIVVLTDDSDQQDPHSNPTKSNIIRAMQWLVQDAKPNDSLFFHYSGHGGQTEDLDGDEDDGYDEVIYPVDYETAGHIVDDYSTEGKIKEPNLTVEASQGLLGAVSSYARGDMRGVLKSVTGFVKTATTARQTKSSPADVISWSGCKDSQTSADAVEDGSPTGAMSYAFIAALTEQPQQSYQELLVNIR
ncbi:peptidase C14, caspase domain-containing protein [Lactifluus subvellereus]|nr:peptidase C14, caspase domain-containing protein [Lactifluus subvellereus]